VHHVALVLVCAQARADVARWATSMDAMPLPALDPDRTALRFVWDVRYRDQHRLRFEAEVYEIKVGRQLTVRCPLS
jgi:hypothetical protein